MKTTIFVAAHKKYKMPTDTLYQPIFVGSALHDTCPQGYVKDNSGMNISKLNPYFNELTAIYWAWKNDDSDVKGLVHYRRYLAIRHDKGFAGILNHQEVSELLSNVDIIVPKKRHYWIETNYSHYLHAHQSEALGVLADVLKEKYPNYVSSYDKVMHRTSAHMFNMFIMRDNKYNEYCTWLFDVLFEIQKKLDISNYTASEQRVFGYISELMLDIWLDANTYHFQEVSVKYLEGQKILNRGFHFLIRKMFPNKVNQKTHF